MGVTVIICKFKDGKELPFPKQEVEIILTKYAQEKGYSDIPSGIAFLQQQPWFESCDFVPVGNDLAAILISKPNTGEPELEEVIFRLLAMNHSVLMSEHFDMFHSRTNMTSHFPADMKEVMTAMDQDDFHSIKVIETANELWPAEYKYDEDDGY